MNIICNLNSVFDTGIKHKLSVLAGEIWSLNIDLLGPVRCSEGLDSTLHNMASIHVFDELEWWFTEGENKALQSVMANTGINHIIELVLLDEIGKSFVNHLDGSCSIDVKWDTNDIIHDAVKDTAYLVRIWLKDQFLSKLISECGFVDHLRHSWSQSLDQTFQKWRRIYHLFKDLAMSLGHLVETKVSEDALLVLGEMTAGILSGFIIVWIKS